jgi:uncharacterized protein (TIGR00730 family)
MIATAGLELVYGGARVGLMGIVADAALAAGGDVIGVLPQALMDRELAHRSLTRLHITRSMHERKALMADLADGFVALPGGIGTFEELFEIWTWGQLGYHAKPVALLDIAGFYQPLLAFLDTVVAAGFVREAHRALLIDESEPGRLIDRMRAFTSPAVAKWIGSAER